MSPGQMPLGALTEETKAYFTDRDRQHLFTTFIYMFYDWMKRRGLNPDREEGLSERTAANYIDRLNQIFQTVWSELEIDVNEGELPFLTPYQATVIVDMLDNDEITKKNGEPYGEDSKRKFTNTIQKYAEFRADDGEEKWEEWEPPVTFSQSDYDGADLLTLKELGLLTEAAETLYSYPRYEDTSPDERDRINAELAQFLGKPKAQISREDWNHEGTGSKFPSLVMTTQDGGLAPIEIHRANISWIDFDRGVLEIPEEAALKERDSNEVSLTTETLDELKHWMEERRQYDKYSDTEALWLNNSGNRYTTRTLNDLLDKLLDEAGINEGNRQIVWYSFRKSLGTYARELESLDMAGDLLRHDTIETTREFYTEVAPELQRQTVSDIRDLSEHRARGELSEEEVAQMLRPSKNFFFDLFKDRLDSE